MSTIKYEFLYTNDTVVNMEFVIWGEYIISGRDATDSTTVAARSDLASRRRASTEPTRCGFYIPKSIIPVLKSLFMGDVKITHFSQLAQTSES